LDVKLGIKSLPLGASNRVIESNLTAISQRRAAIKKALDRVEQMRFEVVEDLAGEIASIKKSIPRDSYPTSRTEAPIPRIQDQYERYGGDSGDKPKNAEPRITWS
jgi:hypothetical protein